MTITEIASSDKTMLTPQDIADVLGADPQTVRVTARTRPETVGFPYTLVGNRMKIPRDGFLNWFYGRRPDKHQ